MKKRILPILIFICASPLLFATNNWTESGKYNYPSQEKIDRQVDSVFRTLSTREKIALQMVEDMNMTSTSVSEKIFTTGYDLNKFYFTLNNGGKYAGRQVLSPKAAEIVLKSL